MIALQLDFGIRDASQYGCITSSSFTVAKRNIRTRHLCIAHVPLLVERIHARGPVPGNPPATQYQRQPSQLISYISRHTPDLYASTKASVADKGRGVKIKEHATNANQMADAIRT